MDPNFGTIGLFGAVLAPSRYTDPVMKEPRRKIDAELEAKIALEALREQATVVDLAMKCRGPQSLENRARDRAKSDVTSWVRYSPASATPFEIRRFSGRGVGGESFRVGAAG